MFHDPRALTLHAVGDRQIRIERRFAADVQRVFDAFTQPDQVLQWMDTPEWPLTTCEADLREGGAIRYEWGDGKMGLTGRYLRIDAPHLTEHTELFDEDWTGGEATVLTEFLPEGPHTLVRMTMTYASTEARDLVLASPMQYGIETNYRNLDDALLGHTDWFTPDPELDLVLERVVAVPPERVWQAWTDPELLVQWFTPSPWSTAAADVKAVPGGPFDVTMRSPEGEEMPNKGCVLAAIENRLLVWTDAFTRGFRPAPSCFMTGILILRPHPEGTLYRAIARHGNEETKRQHEEMGFHHGWGAAADQLVTLMTDRRTDNPQR